MKNSTSPKTMLLFLSLAFLCFGKLYAQLPSLTVTITNATNCTAPCNGTASVPVVSGATYVWNTSPVQNTATATGLCPGVYTCTATISTFSSNGSGTVACSGSGVVDIITASSLNVFPNPAAESVSLDLSSTIHGNYTLNIYNVLGKVVRTETISIDGNMNKQYDISNLSKGVYFIELKNDKNFYAGKFLKQ